MPEIRWLLILGGTTEAADLAARAVERWPDRVEVVTSLAGRTRTHRPLPGRVRIGGFGGVAGLIDALRAERIDWLIDATHPFAATISTHAYDACLATETPRLALVRPPWTAEANHPWVEVDSMAEAAGLLPKIGRRVFLTVGRQGLDAFSGVDDVWFLVRLIEPAEKSLPLRRHLVVTGRPPHDLADETRLLQNHRIDLLISKQSGGTVTESKIRAANRLGIPIVMIRRPLPEPGPLVDSVDDALAWIERRLNDDR